MLVPSAHVLMYSASESAKPLLVLSHLLSFMYFRIPHCDSLNDRMESHDDNPSSWHRINSSMDMRYTVSERLAYRLRLRASYSNETSTNMMYCQAPIIAIGLNFSLQDYIHKLRHRSKGEHLAESN